MRPGIGGGADLARNQAQLPAGIEVREDFSDTAYWNPVVETDAKWGDASDPDPTR